MSALELDLNLKTSQRLTLTPQMQQSIRILNMNSLEVKEYLAKEMLENPMLSFDKNHETAENSETREIDWQSYFKEMDSTPAAPTAYDADAEVWHPEPHRRTAETLEEHLLLQLHTHAQIDDRLGEYIIGCIDGDGYINIDLAAAADALDVTQAEMQKTLAAVQTFDPSGVGARDIGECLSLQLRALDEWNETRQMLIDDYLLPIANNQFAKVAAATKIPAADIAAFKMLLTELNPRPGAAFDSDAPTEYILPDGSISNVDGKLVVHINEIGAPRLTLNAVYRRMLANPDSEKTKAYLEACLNRARFVISCIDMRRETIRKILTAIAEAQADYFFSRTHYLRPMTQSEIAAVAGVHESTVSRAIRGKYVRTPRGTFAIKDFFTRGYENGAGDAAEISVDGIKDTLEKWIAAEDPAHPLSDQALSDKFEAKGVTIARRTIAKYRKELGLPNASKRKKRI